MMLVVRYLAARIRRKEERRERKWMVSRDKPRPSRCVCVCVCANEAHLAWVGVDKQGMVVHARGVVGQDSAQAGFAARLGTHNENLGRVAEKVGVRLSAAGRCLERRRRESHVAPSGPASRRALPRAASARGLRAH